MSTAEGEILLVGGSGNVALNAVDGQVIVAGASGKRLRMHAESRVNESRSAVARRILVINVPVGRLQVGARKPPNQSPTVHQK